MPRDKETSGTVRVNPGLWVAAITIVTAIVMMTGAILSRPTQDAVEKAVRSELAPLQMEVRYLKEAIERTNRDYLDRSDPEKEERPRQQR